MADEAAINIALRLIDNATAPMRTAMQQVAASTRSVDKAVKGLAGSFGSLGQMAIGGGIAAVVAGILRLGKYTIDADTGIKALGATFGAITGTQRQAGNEFAYIVEQANKFGFLIDPVAAGYVKITAAARGTTLQGQATRDIFESITQAGAVLRLSNEQVNGALLAVSQMMSKGKVQAEELRGQLGERIPGAFQLAARAMNMTGLELDKFMADGKLMAEDFLPKFAKVLNDEYAAGLANAADQTDKSVNRMLNSLQLLAADFSEGSGLSAGFRRIINHITGMTSALRELPARFQVFGQGVKARLEASFKETGELNGPLGLLGALWGGAKDADKPLPGKPTTVQGKPSFDPEMAMAEGQRLFMASNAKLFSKYAEDSAKDLEKARTPLQKYNDTLAESNARLSVGIINQQDYAQLTKKAWDDYEKDLKKGVKKAPEPYMDVDVDQIARAIGSKKGELEKIFRDVSFELESSIATAAGRGLDANMAHIGKQFSDFQTDTYKKIAEANDRYTEFAQKLMKRGGTAEAFSELDRAKRELDAAWSTGLSAIDVAERMKNVQGVQASRLWYADQKQSIAQTNVEYVALTGTMKDQYGAQQKLIEAALEYNVIGKPTDVAKAYRDLAQEQLKILEINKNGTFIQGFMDEARVIGNTLPTAAMEGRQTMQLFKSEVSSVAEALSQLSTNGSADFSSLIRSIGKDFTKLGYEFILMKAMFGGMSGTSGGSSSGGGIFGWITSGISSLFGGDPSSASLSGFDPAIRGYDSEGWVTEPTIGRGLRSGKWISLAENNPEYVSNPARMPMASSAPPRVTFIFNKVPDSASIERQGEGRRAPDGSWVFDMVYKTVKNKPDKRAGLRRLLGVG